MFWLNTNDPGRNKIMKTKTGTGPSTRTVTSSSTFAGKILKVIAHFGGPGGIAVGLQADAGLDLEAFARVALPLALREYDEGGATADNLTSQLRDWATDGQDWDLKSIVIALMNVEWLVQRGHVKADEFNGLQWAYILNSDPTKVIFGEQNPVTLDLGAIEGIDVTQIIKSPGAHEALRVVSDYARTEPKPTTDWRPSRPNRAQRRAAKHEVR